MKNILTARSATIVGFNKCCHDFVIDVIDWMDNMLYLMQKFKPFEIGFNRQCHCSPTNSNCTTVMNDNEIYLLDHRIREMLASGNESSHADNTDDLSNHHQHIIKI